MRLRLQNLFASRSQGVAQGKAVSLLGSPGLLHASFYSPTSGSWPRMQCPSNVSLLLNPTVWHLLLLAERLWTACSIFTQQVHSLVTSRCPGCCTKVSSLLPCFNLAFDAVLYPVRISF